MPKKSNKYSLPKNRITVDIPKPIKTEPAEEAKESPRNADIRIAKGGYIINLRGGKADWSDPDIVKESLDDGLSVVKNWLENEKGPEKKKEE